MTKIYIYEIQEMIDKIRQQAVSKVSGYNEEQRNILLMILRYLQKLLDSMI